MVKLHAYVIDLKSMRMIQQHLSHRKQRVKVGNAYNSWKNLFTLFFRSQFLVHLYPAYFCVTDFISWSVTQ